MIFVTIIATFVILNYIDNKETDKETEMYEIIDYSENNEN